MWIHLRKGRWVLTKGDKRRCMLLVVGFGAGFCVLWLLITRIYIDLIDYRAAQPVISVQMKAPVNRQVKFPCSVTGTDLVVRRVVAYDGPFFENGQPREVINIAALHLSNVGKENIEKAYITLSRGAEQYMFLVDLLPAGASVIVPEKDGKEYNQDPFTTCSGWAYRSQICWDADGTIQIDEVDMGTLAVTNLTEGELVNIHLYYKNYLSSDELLVGGKAFCIDLPSIAPGQTVMVYPDNYARGYSRIVRFWSDECNS